MATMNKAYSPTIEAQIRASKKKNEKKQNTMLKARQALKSSIAASKTPVDLRAMFGKKNNTRDNRK